MSELLLGDRKRWGWGWRENAAQSPEGHVHFTAWWTQRPGNSRGKRLKTFGCGEDHFIFWSVGCNFKKSAQAALIYMNGAIRVIPFSIGEANDVDHVGGKRPTMSGNAQARALSHTRAGTGPPLRDQIAMVRAFIFWFQA